MTENSTTISLNARAFMFIIPSVLHTFGFYPLYVVRKHHQHNNQYLYLLHLSFSEIIVSVHMFIKRVFVNWLNDVFMSAFYSWYIVVMTLLTVDRFLEVYLSIRYSLYFSTKKTKLTLCLSLIVPVSIPVAVLLSSDNYTERVNNIFVYVYPVVNYSFLFVAVLVYGYIFIQRRKVKIHMRRLSTTFTSTHYSNNTEIVGNITSQPVKKNKRNGENKPPRRKRGNFYIPALLIVTFFVFWIVPDIVISYYVIKKHKSVYDLFFVLDTFYCLGLVSDVLIYTLFSRAVRYKISKMLSLR